MVDESNEAAIAVYRRLGFAYRGASGELRHQETVTEGLDRAPEAFMGMPRGENVGKALVTL
jgi:NADPH-dependent curcumin reductase CurA